MTPTTVWLDPSDPSEPFQGWGTALAWFGHATGGWPDPVRQRLADLLYGSDGLGLTIARYNIGGGDGLETERYLRPGADVPGWWRRPAGIGPVPDVPWGRTGAPHHGSGHGAAARATRSGSAGLVGSGPRAALEPGGGSVSALVAAGGS